MSLNQAMATMMVVTIGQMDNQSIAVVRRAIVLPQYGQGYTTGAAQLACCNNQPVNHVCPKIFSRGSSVFTLVTFLWLF